MNETIEEWLKDKIQVGTDEFGGAIYAKITSAKEYIVALELFVEFANNNMSVNYGELDWKFKNNRDFSAIASERRNTLATLRDKIHNCKENLKGQNENT